MTRSTLIILTFAAFMGYQNNSETKQESRVEKSNNWAMLGHSKPETTMIYTHVSIKVVDKKIYI